jgi:N-acetyl-gamma-glutamyl-phosphate reductase
MTLELGSKIRIGILGASGYTGAELVRLLARHPNADIVFMTADSHAGEPYEQVYPHLGGLDLPVLVKVDEVEWAGIEVDAVFCGLPHGTTQEIIAGLMHQTGHSVMDEVLHEGPGDAAAAIQGSPRVIDLSADFRLDSTDTYAEYYGHEHYAPHLQPLAVYGLTEMARDKLPDAQLVACPGCYPTASILPLAPLLAAGKIAAEDIIIDAKTGITGAGRAAKAANLFSEVSEGMHAYAIGTHRHGPEIEQELSKAYGEDLIVNFTPHLAPMNRGIISTHYVRLAGGAGVDDLRDCLQERYQDEPFVRVVAEGVAPATRDVRGSNHCLIGVFADRLPGRAIIISVIDNLVKGSSGQAIQNMNLMYGLPETTGLEQEALFP